MTDLSEVRRAELDDIPFIVELLWNTEKPGIGSWSGVMTNKIEPGTPCRESAAINAGGQYCGILHRECGDCRGELDHHSPTTASRLPPSRVLQVERVGRGQGIETI